MQFLLVLLLLLVEFSLGPLAELGAEIGLDDGGVLEHLRRRTVAQHRAVVKYDQPLHQ